MVFLSQIFSRAAGSYGFVGECMISIFRYALGYALAFLTNLSLRAEVDLPGLETFLKRHPIPEEKFMYDPGDYASARRLDKYPLIASDIEKAKFILKRAHDINLFFNGPTPTLEGFVRTLHFIRLARKKIAKFQSKKRDRYFYPDGQRLFFPVGILKNGRCYLHFSDTDPRKKSGGYKTFSRSLDCDTGEAWAHLVMDAPADGKLKEMKILQALADLPNVIGYRDLMIFPPARGVPGGKKPPSGTWKLSLISPLFDHDLGGAYQRFQGLASGVHMALQAAESLRDVHARGIVHRDLKPANFFVRQKDSLQVLADFGLSEWGDALSFGKHLKGSRGYLAPEMCERRFSGRKSLPGFQEGVDADNFALGMTFYSLLKGEDNPLRKYNRRLNEAALPKDKSKGPDQDMFEDNFELYKEQHVKFCQAAGREISDSGGAFQSYEALLCGLLHPTRNRRISLEFFISGLKKLQAGQIPARQT